MQVERYSTRKNDHTILFNVVLTHEEKLKNITVTNSFDNVTQRKHIEQLATSLNLPILKKDGKEIIIDREAKRINEIVLQKYRREKQQVDLSQYNAVVPSKTYNGFSYIVSDTKDGFKVIFRPKLGTLIGGLMIISGLCILIAKFVFYKNMQTGMAGGLVIIGVIFSLPFKEIILLNSTGITFLSQFGRLNLKTTSIPYNEVEEVKVDRDPNKGTGKRFTQTVQIISDNNIISFGHGSGKADKEWLANRLKE